MPKSHLEFVVSFITRERYVEDIFGVDVIGGSKKQALNLLFVLFYTLQEGVITLPRLIRIYASFQAFLSSIKYV